MLQKLRVAPLVAIWYSASVLAVWSAKRVLSELPCPATLCVVQFAVAVAGTRMVLPAAARRMLYGKAEVRVVRAIALAYTSGFLLTNAAIAIAAPSVIETLKAAEPLSTVAMAMLVLGEHERWQTLLALLPIVVGVAMACSGAIAFNTFGVVLAISSNLAFSGRAVLTKSLKRDHPSALVARSDACLFFHVSRCGLCLLIPCAFVLDARTLLASSTGSTSSEGGAGDGAGDGVGGGAGGGARIGLLLVLNGMAHALYNGVSFVVLAKVSISTHAVLNIVRRVLVIAIAAALFATPISAFNWSGVALAVVGVVLFAASKTRGGVIRTRPKNLLPV